MKPAPINTESGDLRVTSYFKERQHPIPSSNFDQENSDEKRIHQSSKFRSGHRSNAEENYHLKISMLNPKNEGLEEFSFSKRWFSGSSC